MIIIICLCSPNSEASALSQEMGYLSFEIQQTFIGHPLVWSRGMLDILKSEGIYIEGLGPVELDLQTSYACTCPVEMPLCKGQSLAYSSTVTKGDDGDLVLHFLLYGDSIP